MCEDENVENKIENETRNHTEKAKLNGDCISIL